MRRLPSLSSVVVGLVLLCVFAIACGDDDPAAGSGGAGGPNDGGTGFLPPSDGSSSDASTGPKETWAVTGSAVNGSAVISVAKDDAHLFVSSKPTSGTTSRLEKRRLDTGALEPGFGTGGVVEIDPNSFIAVDGSAVYLVSLDFKLRKLDKGTGAQVWENLSGAGSSPAGRGIGVDGSGLYVAGATSSDGFGGWSLRKHALDTGEPIAGWSADTPSVFGGTSPRAMVVTSDGLFVGGDIANSSAAPTNYAWRVQGFARSTPVTRSGRTSRTRRSMATSSTTSRSHRRGSTRSSATTGRRPR